MGKNRQIMETEVLYILSILVLLPSVWSLMEQPGNFTEDVLLPPGNKNTSGNSTGFGLDSNSPDNDPRSENFTGRVTTQSTTTISTILSPRHSSTSSTSKRPANTEENSSKLTAIIVCLIIVAVVIFAICLGCFLSRRKRPRQNYETNSSRSTVVTISKDICADTFNSSETLNTSYQEDENCKPHDVAAPRISPG